LSAIVTVKDLIESGVHFGHQVSRWNPKMAPFIQAKRNSIHIIDLKATLRGLLRARHFLHRLASSDEQVLFVGTKRQVRTVVESEAVRSGMPYVTERWIGGTLTNFQTIRSRLKRLEELEAMEVGGQMAAQSKKQQASLRRELRKVKRNLDGIRTMDGMPGAMVVVDPRREFNAIHEANKLSIPVVAILDTDCDPETVGGRGRARPASGAHGRAGAVGARVDDGPVARARPRARRAGPRWSRARRAGPRRPRRQGSAGDGRTRGRGRLRGRRRPRWARAGCAAGAGSRRVSGAHSRV